MKQRRKKRGRKRNTGKKLIRGEEKVLRNKHKDRIVIKILINLIFLLSQYMSWTLGIISFINGLLIAVRLKTTLNREEKKIIK
jgi:hypothetical protein